MAPLWTLLAHFAAGRVIQSEPLLPVLLDRFGPVARGDAFQVLAPRPQAGPRARPPLLAGSKPKRKKKRRPAGGGEPAKGFAAPEPAEPAAPPRAKPTGQRKSSDLLGSDEYDRSTIELDKSQMKAEPGEVLAQYVSKSKVEGAATGRVPAEPVPGCEPVFELASLEAFEAARVGSLSEPGLYPQVKAALMALPPDEQAMTTFYQANRDLLDYRFLYMLTSEKLRAENTNDNATSEVLNAARVRALKAGLKFDTALYKQVAAAETRLGGVLSGYVQGKPPDAKAVRAAAGETPSEIFAFWFVLKAAEAAWESKAAENADLAQQAGQKLGDLAEVRGVLESGELLDRAGAREVNELLKLPDLSGYSPLGEGSSSAPGLGHWTSQRQGRAACTSNEP